MSHIDEFFFYGFRYLNRFRTYTSMSHTNESFFPFSLSILFLGFNSVSIFFLMKDQFMFFDFTFVNRKRCKRSNPNVGDPISVSKLAPKSVRHHTHWTDDEDYSIYRQDSQNEEEPTSKIQPVVSDFSLFQNSRQNPLYINL